MEKSEKRFLFVLGMRYWTEIKSFVKDTGEGAYQNGGRIAVTSKLRAGYVFYVTQTFSEGISVILENN